MEYDATMCDCGHLWEDHCPYGCLKCKCGAGFGRRTCMKSGFYNSIIVLMVWFVIYVMLASMASAVVQ